LTFNAAEADDISLSWSIYSHRSNELSIFYDNNDESYTFLMFSPQEEKIKAEKNFEAVAGITVGTNYYGFDDPDVSVSNPSFGTLYFKIIEE
jgi:hypothetical protein